MEPVEVSLYGSNVIQRIFYESSLTPLYWTALVELAPIEDWDRFELQRQQEIVCLIRGCRCRCHCDGIVSAILPLNRCVSFSSGWKKGLITSRGPLGKARSKRKRSIDG